MLTLYHAPQSPSSRMVWLLEELQADYHVQVVRFPQADGSQADPRNPHPHGYAPALEHDGQIVTETGAIALYLTDLFPASEIGVAVGQPLRAQYLSWLFYQVGLTEPLVYMQGKKMLEQDPAMAYLNTAMVQHIVDTLERSPYLLGARFSAVDVLFMSLFEQARPLLGASVAIDHYLARADRPARRRALAKHG
jgi:glutathione S-transferase